MSSSTDIVLAQSPQEAQAYIRPQNRHGIWTTNDIYIRLVQRIVRGRRKCKFPCQYTIAVYSPSLSDTFFLAIQTTSEEFRRGHAAEDPTRLPPPFRQQDMYRVMQFPNGIGPGQWLPGLRLPMTDNVFDVNLFAVGMASPIVLTRIDL